MENGSVCCKPNFSKWKHKKRSVQSEGEAEAGEVGRMRYKVGKILVSTANENGMKQTKKTICTKNKEPSLGIWEIEKMCANGREKVTDPENDSMGTRVSHEVCVRRH